MSNPTPSGQRLDQRLDTLIDQFRDRPYRYPGLSRDQTDRLHADSNAYLLARLFGVLPTLLSTDPDYRQQLTKTRLFEAVERQITAAIADERANAERVAARNRTRPMHAKSDRILDVRPKCGGDAGRSTYDFDDVDCSACIEMIEREYAARAAARADEAGAQEAPEPHTGGGAS